MVGLENDPVCTEELVALALALQQTVGRFHLRLQVIFLTVTRNVVTEHGQALALYQTLTLAAANRARWSTYPSIEVADAVVLIYLASNLASNGQT